MENLKTWLTNPNYQTIRSSSPPCKERSRFIPDFGSDERLRKRHRFILCATGGLVAASLFVLTLLLTTNKQTTSIRALDPPTPAAASPQTCGISPADAEAAGCTFDVLAFAWVPPACYNASLAREWEAEWGPWEWETTTPAAVGRSVIPSEAVRGYSSVYAPRRYWEVSCLYALRVAQLAGAKGYVLSSDGGSLAQTEACVRALAPPGRGRGRLEVSDVVRVEASYARCVRLF